MGAEGTQATPRKNENRQEKSTQFGLGQVGMESFFFFSLVFRCLSSAPAHTANLTSATRVRPESALGATSTLALKRPPSRSSSLEGSCISSNRTGKSNDR